MRSLSLRRANDPANPSDLARAGRRFHDRVMSERRRTIINRCGIVVLAALCAVALVAGLSKPLAVRQLQGEVAALKQKVAVLAAPGYPVASVKTIAMEAVAQCASYSDQASNTQVQTVEADCGWNGTAVAIPIGLPQFNENPTLMPAPRAGYTALPFVVQLMGSSNFLTYYVPVHQTSTGTAVVAGVPTPLNTPPSFVVNGCPGATAENASGNQRVQAVDAMVSGAARYTIPGVSITFNGSGLSGAVASDEQLCNPQGNTQLVLATVTFNGPTQGSQVAVGLAFNTTVISTEVRITGVGLNAAYKPQAVSP